MATQAERNARLEALKTATNKWAEARTKYLNDQVAAAKKMLKGRTGSERLASQHVTIAKELVVDEIDTFLTG